MNKQFQEKATAILDAARIRKRNAEPIPCLGRGLLQALPESSAHLLTEPAR